MKESNLLSGVLQSVEGKPVIFFADRDTHEFSFTTDTVYSPTKSNTPFFLEPEEGFVYGQTHNGYNVAVYIGSERFLVLGRQRLFTPAYVISASNVEAQDITSFRGIRFIGHTLNSVFPPEIVRFYDEECRLVIEEKDKCIIHKILTNKYSMELTINAPETGAPGVDGLPNTNTDVMLDIMFDSVQPLSSLFDHYNRMKELLSFMTFRYNVGFRAIELIARHPELGFIIKTADVYILDEAELTTKDPRRNISFHDLGDALPGLLKLFYDTEDKKPSYSLGFYPQSDQDAHRMNDSMIRAICSGIECEIGFIPAINGFDNTLLNNLIEKVRQDVKAFRKENKGLSNDTYNMIFSSIGNWSFPLAEKVTALYHIYDDEMWKVNRARYRVYDPAIKEFVKYRNDITHGRHRVLDHKIAVTAHVLAGLVYCCLLSRIGVSRDKILELCQDEKIVT